MTFQGDPYRTLGVAPGASLNEVRSAYRRLVKQYHPDAAGDRALPRFLAIQAAYERLVDVEGRLRSPGQRAGRAATGGTTRPAGEPWRADPARARASRDAWRARRSAGSSPGGGPEAGAGASAGTGTGAGAGASAGPSAGAGASAGASARTGTGAGAPPGTSSRTSAPRDAGRGSGTGAGEPRGARTGRPGEADAAGASSGTAGGRSDDGGRRGSRSESRSRTGSGADDGAGRRARGSRSERASRRGPKKATQGSTTYDEAAELPLDPAWDGGAWYGPSSGTYWTLNPREYADPRKHGPEYLARARRATRGSGAADGGSGAADGGSGAADGRSTRDTGARDTPEAAAHAPGEVDPAPGPAPRSGVESEGGRWRWRGDEGTTTDGGNAKWGTRAWTYDSYDSRPFPGTEWTDGTTGRRDPRPVGGSAGLRVDDASPLPDIESIARRAAPRSLLALARRPGWRWRLLLALVGWPPIGFAAGTLIATATGCGTFSAGCPEPMTLLPTAAQPLVVLALFLGAPAAAAAAFASLVALAVALPVAAVLSVGSLPDSRVGAPVLGGLTAGGYLVALVAGVVGVRRAGPEEAARDPET